ncbi:MAG: LL-diaminopimelate aminotransferase [Candidatus Adiutrix intracellularis]|jgi:LL-diaminopimelate aminotransferase|nr:LL-diaminopimelate aminotransferase [Candidatus Adiutrix intracellularis]
MTFEFTERLRALPPYLFKELDWVRDEVRAKGMDIIDLGVGDPDRPTPAHIIAALETAAGDRVNHKYPTYSGMNAFLDTVVRWYQRRHGVALNGARQVCSLIGSKEGIANFPLAFVNPGDVVLVPEPGYPVYNSGTLFAGGRPYFLPLLAKNGFRPDFKAVSEDIMARAKIIWVNYPNNPTGASADLNFYGELVEWAKKWQIIVASDAAYSEISWSDKPHPSLLEVPGALEVAVEFHSLSKTYNMTGWRLGWAAGNETLIQGLGLIKSNIDSGVFQAVQMAGIAALEGNQAPVWAMGRLYRERREVLAKGLEAAGLEIFPSEATFYVWVRLPAGLKSVDFASRLMHEAGIVVIPGNGFGPSGEGYVRFALVQEVPRLREAASRLAKLKF